MDEQALIGEAIRIRANAHARYSGYYVGAAILDEQGRVHVGCNVENASFPEGSCAEANAIGAMVAAGGRRIVTIAVSGGWNDGATDEDGPAEVCTPCGGCRQRIFEFSDEQTRIILLDANGEEHSWTIAELLPESFRLRPR